MDDVTYVWGFLLFLLGSVLSSPEMAKMRLKKILDHEYNKSLSPVAKTSGSAVLVSISMHLNEIRLDAEEMVMKIHGDVVQSWIDGRLAPVTQDTKDFRLSPKFTDFLWTPEITVWNSRQGSSLLDDRQRRLLIAKDGLVVMEQRVFLDVVCNNFTSHMRPLICSLQLQLRYSTVSEVVLDWETVKPDPSLFVPGYTLARIETGDCTRTSSTGTYSCKQLSFEFRCDVSFFATEVYGVSFLLVILSWIGFWIDGQRPNQVFVRIGLGLAILLIFVVYGIGFRVLHNKVGVPGNVEVWLAFCVLFVLASLVEFAFVHVLLRIIPGKLRQLFCSRQFTEDDEERGNFFRAAQVIDVTCGFLFPLIFILFNVVYWGTY